MGCRARRNEGLFPAVRATLGAEPARSGKGCRDPVAPWRDPWLPPRSNIRGSATCMRSMRDERTVSPRTQPKTKNLRQAAGFRQRPACQWRYSPLPARPGGVRQVVRNALSGAGPGQRPFPVRLRCDPLRISRFGRHATRLVVIGQVPISADVIGIFSGDWMLDCLRRRHMGLFPAV